MLKTLFAMILAWSLASPAMAADEAAKPPKVFAEDAAMAVTLNGPWRTVMRNKSDDKRYPGTIEYTTRDGEQRTLPVEYTTRGLTRRDKICDFPPLKIHFDKDASKGTEFRGQKSLKLVSFCQTDRRFDQYNQLEYLAYRIYNQITPYSFKVRALEATYQDSERSSWDVSRFSFLIEDIDELAERLDLEEISLNTLKPDELDPVETTNVALFQFMIGNLDWAATAGPGGGECCHNGKLIAKDASERPVFVIPYDFDSSGLVDTHYAAPPRQLGIRSLRQRLYRGFCVDNGQVVEALGRFRQQQEAIMSLFDDLPSLSGRSRSSAVRFIESFYTDLDSTEAVQQELIDKCRG